MLSFKINERNLEKMEIIGNVQVITAETLCMVQAIYLSLKKNNENIANAFKVMIEGSVKDGIIFATPEELKKIIRKKEGEKKEAVKKKKIKDVMEFIEQLKSTIKKDEESEEEE